MKKNKEEKLLAVKPALNIQQRAFCYYYTLNGETFNNLTKSYAVAYEIDLPLNERRDVDMYSKEYKVCQAASSRMYSLTKIKDEVERIMLEKLNNKSVDTRLSGILHYGKDTDSLQAIKVYNELNNRIVKNLNINVVARPFESVSDDDLAKIANGEN